MLVCKETILVFFYLVSEYSTIKTNTSREPGTVHGTARRTHFSRAFISVTVQLWT